MKYLNKRLGLTAEPAKLYKDKYTVEIDGETVLIHKSLIEGSSDWEKEPDEFLEEHVEKYSIADIRKAWNVFLGGVDDFINVLKEMK